MVLSFWGVIYYVLLFRNCLGRFCASWGRSTQVCRPRFWGVWDWEFESFSPTWVKAPQKACQVLRSSWDQKARNKFQWCAAKVASGKELTVDYLCEVANLGLSMPDVCEALSHLGTLLEPNSGRNAKKAKKATEEGS